MYFKSIMFLLALKFKWLQALQEVDLLPSFPKWNNLAFISIYSPKITFSVWSIYTRKWRRSFTENVPEILTQLHNIFLIPPRLLVCCKGSNHLHTKLRTSGYWGIPLLSKYSILIIHYSLNNILMTLFLPLIEASVTEDNSRNVAGVSNVFSIISVEQCKCGWSLIHKSYSSAHYRGKEICYNLFVIWTTSSQLHRWDLSYLKSAKTLNICRQLI